MATGSQTLTTYYAKRIIGDAAAANASSALLQTGTGITTDTWILNRTSRSTAYGIKYLYDNTVNNEHDKIQFVGGGTVTAWVQLDTGDVNITGNTTIAGVTHITNTTAASLDLEGALVVDGGISVDGAVYATKAFRILKAISVARTATPSSNRYCTGLIMYDTPASGDSYAIVGGVRAYHYKTGNHATQLVAYRNTVADDDGTFSFIMPNSEATNQSGYISWTGKSVNNDILPYANNSHDLGSSSYRWLKLYSTYIDLVKAGECGLDAENTSKSHKVGFIVGGTSGNGGIYDRTNSKWIVYSTPAGDVTLNGNANTSTEAKYLMNRGGNTVSIADSSWGLQFTPLEYTNRATVFSQKWTQSGLTYTPSGGSATAISDTADLKFWLSSHNTANALILNMELDGFIFAGGGFRGNVILSGNNSSVYANYTPSGGSETNYYVLRNHNNGNVSLSAASLGLYIGYTWTSETHFFYSTSSSSRTEFLTINSDGAYAQTRFGVNGQDTSYNFYVNGTSYLNGTTTSSGNIIVTTTNSDRYVEVKSTTTGVRIELDNSGATNHGLWSSGYWNGSAYTASSLWMIYRDAAGIIYVNGRSNGVTILASNTAGTDTNLFSTNGLNIRWYDTANKISGQPSQYGFLFTVALGESHNELHQLWAEQANGSLYHRGTNDSSHASPPAFKTILDSSNYTSYTVTKTGSGASGSWGISITGSSASCTGAASSATYASSYLASRADVAGTDHAVALQNYFNSNKSTEPRNVLVAHYSSAYGNGSMCMGYFLSGYDSNPYGGFFVAHYKVPRYVGIQNGSYVDSKLWKEGDSVTGAVWNDYAEYRTSSCTEPGYCVFEVGDDTLAKTTERLQHFAGIISDTWGFSQGETETAKTPIAVSGRVLAYTYRDRNEYKPGDCVCAAPNGTVDIMTRDEIMLYPDKIVGTVSCVPEYEEWGGGEKADRNPVKVNSRIWIKVK